MDSFFVCSSWFSGSVPPSVRVSSVVWRPVPSAASLSGVFPVPGVVASAASGSASFFGVRPSSRSASGWVGLVWFRSEGGARSFGRSALALGGCASGLPFLAVRRCGSWWVVSVPVFVSSFSFVAGSSVPLFVSLL
jgi:hypothetical protein